MPTSPVLQKDKDIHFPHFIVLKASAGSGKTHTLTKRYVQFLLSDKIPRNNLRNILAVTFSNNAAREMKERILQWLKSVCLNEKDKVDELSTILSLKPDEIVKRSGRLINSILDNYSDFQVKTLDSFMAFVFKTSAIDFGFNPDLDILINSDSLMENAFNRFLRKVKINTGEGALLKDVVSLVLENKSKTSSYIWDPTKDILDEVKNIYKKLASTGKDVNISDHSQEIREIKSRIISQIDTLENLINKNDLLKRLNSSYPSIVESVNKGQFPDLVGKGFKNSPVKKPGKKDLPGQKTFDLINQEWNKLEEMVKEFTKYFSMTYYVPYLRFNSVFKETLDTVKKQEGKIFIEDINKMLSSYISSDIVPDVYFRIGESISHYLIDEFQDTSPLQWVNLYFLLENSLSEGGSLFVVGDTKQAIYGFRDADYRIMKEFEKQSPFLSTENIVKELTFNYRSRKRILDFNERVFKEILSESKYSEEAGKSGLDSYHQEVIKGETKPGYVEVSIYDKSEEFHEREKIQSLIKELKGRGHSFGDIAVLTLKNEDVIQVSTWLNEAGIPFIPYSNLDIRRRKITGEIIALLHFLNSPPDDLAFAIFFLGEIFSRALEKDKNGMPPEEKHSFFFNNRNNTPFYKSFQTTYEKIWERYFSMLFKSAGYLPLYDLVSEIFRVFMVFETFMEEEATLTKILEVIKDFENKGKNNLRDFLDFVEETGDEGEWNIDVPEGVDAVKVMTIHKSKGLGFPVVINLLYGKKIDRPLGYVIQENDNETTMLKLTKSITKSNADFLPVYNENRTRERVNSLNSLYVGFTRAKEELYVVGVKGGRDKFPFELLPVDEFQPSAKPDLIARKPKKPENRLPTYHHSRPIQYPATRADKIHVEEKKRGEFIHNVLLYVEYLGFEKEKELGEEIDGIIQKIGYESRGSYAPDEIKNTLLKFLSDKEVKKYFLKETGRIIKNEQEFIDNRGNLLRMDRIIIDRESITVMDFKTGKEKEGKRGYFGQIQRYVKTLREIYPGKSINGVLAYVDLVKIIPVPHVGATRRVVPDV